GVEHEGTQRSGHSFGRPRAERTETLVELLLEGAHLRMGLVLQRKNALLDERAKLGIEFVEVPTVVRVSVILAFFERRDRRLFAHRGGSAFDQLGERAPKAGRVSGLSSQPANLVAQEGHA